MNRIEITFKGEVIPLVFGSWVMGQLIKEGYALADLQKSMTENPFEFFSLLVYLGAVNATQYKDKEAYNRNDFYDWIDASGNIGSVEVNRVIKCFTNSLGADVPESKKKATAKKAEVVK